MAPDRLKELIKKTLQEMSMSGGGTAGASFNAGVGMNYATPKAFKKTKLSESSHPWYTSADGYYKGTNPPVHPIGPKSTGNVSQYLKPNATVYNSEGESKTIKSLTNSHLTFTDGTEDYFMNWFPEKPDLYEATYGTGNLGPGPKAGKDGVKDNYYVKAFGYKPVNRKKLTKASKAVDYKDLWDDTYK
jgi:hypothetical protein